MKKAIKIAILSVSLLVASAALSFGIMKLIQMKNTAETGNVLGISWYEPSEKEFTIQTLEELQEFAQLSDFYDFKGQTVKLGADIIINEGTAADWISERPASRWEPIQNFAGTFDGQGHTISGLYARSFDSKMALFVDTNASCTIKNLKLVNSYFETEGFKGVASFVSGGGGTFSGLYSDAIFEHQGENVGGIFSRITKQSTISECWYAGSIHLTLRDAGGIVDVINKAYVTMEHCLFSGSIVSDNTLYYSSVASRVGGICGGLENAASLVLKDSLSCGKIEVEDAMHAGALMGKGDAKTQIGVHDTYVSMDTHTSVVGPSGMSSSFTGNALQLPGNKLNGVVAYQWTTLDFENYWVAIENGTPQLKRFSEEGISLDGVKKAFDISWYHKNKRNFTITTPEQLCGMFILSAHENFQEKSVSLGADIIYNTGNAKDWAQTPPENEWLPIQSYAGIFDGKGHTISGLYSKTNVTLQGLFAHTADSAYLKDFSIKNSYFCNTNPKTATVGSVVGRSYGNIFGIYSDAIVVSYGEQAGGLIGQSNDPDWDGTGDDAVEVSNCWFAGSVSLKGEKTMIAGGIVGLQIQGDLALSHCLNTGTISTEAINIGLHIGGLIGRSNHPRTLTIIDSLNTGKVIDTTPTWEYCIGSVVGRLSDAGMVATFQNTYTTLESYEKYIIGSASPATVKGGATQMKEEMYIGANAYKYTDLDFDKYWALVKDGTPVLKTFQAGNLSTKGIEKAIDNSWYNETDTEFVIKTPKQLLGFALKAAGDTFKGYTIKLGADIDMSSAERWFSIGSRSNYFEGTFDGQGHTISGINQVLDSDVGGLFGGVAVGAKLKNFRLTNSTFTYFDDNLETTGVHIWLGSVCAELRGTMENIYSNATVNSSRSRVGGLVGVANSLNLAEGRPIVSINNCWFDGQINMTGAETRRAGGIVSVAMQGDVRITNCLNSGTISMETTIGAAFTGGIIGTNSAVGTKVLISNCVNTGTVKGPVYWGIGAIVGLPGAKEAVYTIDNTYALNTSCVNDKGVTVLKNYYLGDYAGEEPVALTEAEIKGSAAYYATSLDFDKYWVMKDNQYPLLKTFTDASGVISTASLIKKDTDWYNKDATQLHIWNVEDFYGFMSLAMDGVTFEDQVIYLESDVELNEVKSDTIAKWKAGTETPKNIWFAMGTKSNPFRGVFDGKGHTIKGLYLKTATTGAGLFGYTADATVKDFKLVDSYLESTAPVSAAIGSIIGYGTGKLLDVYSNAWVYTTAIGAGGLVSEATDMRISGCWYEGDIHINNTGASGAYFGGLVGVSKRAIITNCLFSGNLIYDFTMTNAEQGYFGARTGGICGDDGSQKVIINNVINAGKMILTWHHNDETGSTAPYDTTWTGGVVGSVANQESSYQERVYNAVDGSWYIEDKNLTKPIAGNIAMNKLLDTDGFSNTLLDFENMWAARKGNVPAPKKFVKESELADITGLVQADVEWFTENASEYTITKSTQLMGLAALANSGEDFEGITIKLGEDISINTIEAGTLDKWLAGNATGTQMWQPIGSLQTPFSGTFDGQMHTISGIYYTSAVEIGGLFGVVGDKGVVKNLYLKDSVIQSTQNGTNGKLGSVVGQCRGTVDTVYSKAYVVSNAEKTGGIVGWLSGGKATVNNCWYAGELRLSGWYGKNAAGIAGYVGGEAYGATYTLSNNAFTGIISYQSIATGNLMIGGIGGGVWAWYRPIINVTDCISVGRIQAVNTTSVAGVGSIFGYVENLGTGYIPTLNVENVYASNECYSVMVNVQSGTTFNGLAGTGTPIAKEEISGIKGYQKTLLDFEDTWVARTEDVPALKAFSKVIDQTKVITDFTGYEQNQWYNANVTAYGIHSASAFKAFADYTNATSAITFQYKTVYLSDDIEVNEVGEETLAAWKAATGTLPTSWTPISFTTAFQGTFDGRMHTISGVYMKRDATCTSYQGGHGLFGSIGYYGTVKSLYLTDSYFEVTDPRGAANSNPWTNANLGSVTGNNGGKVQNVYSNATVVSNRYQVGGIIGYTGGRGVTNCWYAGTMELKTAHGRTAGGVIGIAGNLETLENLLFTGTISYQNAYYAACNIGGILGSTYNQWSHTITIKNAISAGTLIKTTQTGQVGSVAGVVVTKNGLKLENVYATTDFFEVPYTVNSGATLTGSATPMKEANLYGDLAKTNAPALDYTNTWVTRDGKVPALKIFSKVIK